MSKKFNFKEKITLHPIMSFTILIVVTVFLSGILGFFDVGTTYREINPITQQYTDIEVKVDSLFNLAGVKYIFSNTISNFVNFAPLSLLLIILMGIGIMDKSGFMQAFLTLITKYSNKYRVTFILILFSIIATIAGDVMCVIMIPIGALLFKYGKRNPTAGIISAFAGITCGMGANVFINSIDSSLLTYTKLSASILDTTYTTNVYGFMFIMAIAVIGLSLALTFITEKFVVPRLEKHETDADIEEYTVGRRELRGLIISLGAGILYLLIFTYNIIPGLPLSGNLLDPNQDLYIDKLFGYNSFFSSGSIFVATMLFIILGLTYGISTKKIKNNKDFSDFLGHSLDKVGRIIVLILFASAFIAVFKRTYMGNVFTGLLNNLLINPNLSSMVLIVSLLLVSILSTIFLPSTVLRWSLLSGTVVPIFMNAGLSPEFAQLIFRAGESISLGLTPMFAYFVIYLGFLSQYNNSEKNITIFQAVKHMLPYSIATFVIWVTIILIWYIVGIPLGISTTPYL